MQCPNCGSETKKSFFVLAQETGKSEKILLWQCGNCEVIFADDYGKSRQHIYDGDYAAWGSAKNEKEYQEIAVSKKQAFGAQIRNILDLVNPENSRVLDVGTGNGYLMECLSEKKFQVWGTEISESSAKICEKKFPGKVYLGEIEKANYSDNFFDVVFMTDVLEHLNNSKKVILEIKRILKPGGHIFIISPNSDSITRKIFGKSWFQYKYEHIFYYNKKSLSFLLGTDDFKLIKFKNNRKKFSLDYYCAYFRKYSFL